MSSNKLTRWETLVKVINLMVCAAAVITAAHALIPDAVVAYTVGTLVAFHTTIQLWK